MCCPKYEGGLGLINIKILNKAAIAKLRWDLANKEDKLWIKWIHAYYIKGQRERKMSNYASWMVKKVMNAKLIVDQVQQFQNKVERCTQENILSHERNATKATMDMPHV